MLLLLKRSQLTCGARSWRGVRSRDVLVGGGSEAGVPVGVCSRLGDSLHLVPACLPTSPVVWSSRSPVLDIKTRVSFIFGLTTTRNRLVPAERYTLTGVAFDVVSPITSELAQRLGGGPALFGLWTPPPSRGLSVFVTVNNTMCSKRPTCRLYVRSMGQQSIDR